MTQEQINDLLEHRKYKNPSDAYLAGYAAGRRDGMTEAAKIAVDTINDMRGSGESDLRCARDRVDYAIRDARDAKTSGF